MESFDKVLYDIRPSIFMLQETKRKKCSGKMKTNNLDNFQVFELRREIFKEEGGRDCAVGA